MKENQNVENPIEFTGTKAQLDTVFVAFEELEALWGATDRAAFERETGYDLSEANEVLCWLTVAATNASERFFSAD